MCRFLVAPVLPKFFPFAFVFSLSSCVVSILCALQMTSTETWGSFDCVSTFKCKQKENRHKVILVFPLDVPNTNMDRSKVTFEMRNHLECRSWRTIIFQTADIAIQWMWILFIESFVGVAYGVAGAQWTTITEIISIILKPRKVRPRLHQWKRRIKYIRRSLPWTHRSQGTRAFITIPARAEQKKKKTSDEK